MVVELTSQVLGQAVGTNYTGDLEPWLLAQGYAKQADYEGVGVANTGATDVDPEEDPTLAENREDPYWPLDEDETWSIANDADNLNETSFPNPQLVDFDEGGVDDDAPSNLEVTPATGPAAGGTVVTITGDNLDDATGVTFGGVAGTSFAQGEEGELTVTTPAHAAGAVDVVVVDADGNGTETGGFTYTA